MSDRPQIYSGDNAGQVQFRDNTQIFLRRPEQGRRSQESDHDLAMGFNKRKMETRRAEAAEKEAAARRATEAQILQDAGHLVAAWNERQAKRMPMLFSPTIGCAWVVRPDVPHRPSTCGPSIVTRGPRSRALSRRSRADRAGRTRRLPSLCGCRRPASPMRFVRSERGSQTGGRFGSHILARDRMRATAMPAPIAKAYGCQSARVPSVAKVCGFRS